MPRHRAGPEGPANAARAEREVVTASPASRDPDLVADGAVPDDVEPADSDDDDDKARAEVPFTGSGSLAGGTVTPAGGWRPRPGRVGSPGRGR
ncbi:hypothetical protein GCM10022294_10780 [Dietzia aurantiaca]